MNTLYRSNLTFESIHEFDVTRAIRERGEKVLPDDFRICAIDEGHTLAVYSNDVVCESINHEIALKREASIVALLASPSCEGLTEAEGRALIESEQWGWKGYPIRLTPQRVLHFTGWHKVA